MVVLYNGSVVGEECGTGRAIISTRTADAVFYSVHIIRVALEKQLTLEVVDSAAQTEGLCLDGCCAAAAADLQGEKLLVVFGRGNTCDALDAESTRDVVEVSKV